MTSVSKAPNQPTGPSGKWDWESEVTLVDRRNRLPNRIVRLIRSRWLWMSIGAFLIAALIFPEVAVIFLRVLGISFQIAMYMAIIVLQFVAIFWFMARSRMYTVMPGAEGISFDDYRGQPELLEQAQQIVMLLRGVKAFEGAGGEPLNGLLLEGPPGTGKTWLAKAISTEAGVPFYYVDTSSLQGMFMGVSSLKVAGMYNRARKAAKEYGAAVVFLDEIDAVGARSGVSSVGGGSNGNPLNQLFGGGDLGLLSTLLIEMSGFGQEHGWRARWRAWLYRTFLFRDPPPIERRVLTIGATNRGETLDPALLRPGRFDKKIRVDVPDMAGRRDIFEYYLSKVAHDETMNPALLASETPGYTPADIKYLLNESLRYALFDGRKYTTYRDFRLAQPEHEMGLRAPLKHIAPEARQRTAYHEAGHAVAVRLFMPENRIARITIIRQGAALGHVWHYPARESYRGLQTKDQYLNRLRVSVAGKAGEIEFCGIENQTTGVIGGDFNRILDTLYAMVSAGMLGPLGAGLRVEQDRMTGERKVILTDDQAAAVEEAYQRLLTETRQALRENAHIVHALAKLMLEKEELLADEIRTFFDQYGLYTPDPTLIRDGEEIAILPSPAEAPALP